VQITRFGGPEVLDVVDLPEAEAGPRQKLYDVTTAGVNFADTRHSLSLRHTSVAPDAGTRLSVF
jgi:NADPH:quinone reductase-like Zn-dependent oxidoreductase